MRRMLAAFFVAFCTCNHEALCADPCYLRITNQMPVSVTVSLKGGDLMHGKKRAAGIAAGTYTVRDQGEIYQNVIAERASDHGKAKRDAAPSPIAPGQATDWLDLGPFLPEAAMDVGNDGSTVGPGNKAKGAGKAKAKKPGDDWRSFSLTVQPRGGETVQKFCLRIELSSVKGSPPCFLRKLERDSPTVTLIVPLGKHLPKAMLDEDEARIVLGYLKGLNLPGKLPTRFYPWFGAGTLRQLDPHVRQLEHEITSQMGGTSGLLYTGSFGDARAAVGGSQQEHEEGLQHVPQLLEHWKRSGQDVAAAIAAEKPIGIQITCESGLNDDVFRGDPQEHRRFREYLQGQGLQPNDLGWKNWDEARLEYRTDSPTINPLAYWHTVEFRAVRTSQFYAETTRAIEDLLAALPGARRDRIWVTPLYSDGRALSGAPDHGPFEQGADWWTLEQARQGRAVRTEDYLFSVADHLWLSHQVEGFVLDYLWSVAKRHNEAMVFDVCQVASSVPAELRWRLYATLGRGVRAINHEYHGPTYLQRTFSVQDHLACIAEDARTYRRIGTVEDLLDGGRQPDASVAILISETSEAWAGWPDTGQHIADQFGMEQRMLYYALHHQGIPVEFINEGVLLKGGLKDYQVLYLCGKHLQRASAEKIRQWVADGGTLYSECASGLWDEYNRPNAMLLEPYGLKGAALSGKLRGGTTRALLATLRQPGLKPLSVTVGQSQVRFPAWEVVSRLELKDGSQVLATFDDGSPALVLSHYGKGTCLVTAAMPGLEYGRKALDKTRAFGNRVPLDPAGKKLVQEFPFYFKDDPELNADHCIPVAYSKELRDLIGLPVRLAGIQPRLKLSHGVVDGILLTSPKGAVVTLVNYLVDPIPDFVVRLKLEPGQAVESVWSTERLQNVPFSQEGDVLTIHTPLDLAEMLAVRLRH